MIIEINKRKLVSLTQIFDPDTFLVVSDEMYDTITIYNNQNQKQINSWINRDKDTRYAYSGKIKIRGLYTETDVDYLNYIYFLLLNNGNIV
jgi:hypothetical protein